MKIETDVKMILDNTKRDYRQRLREVAQILYAEGLREVVQKLAA